MKPSTIFLILAFFFMLGLTYMHERVHTEIYRTYGLDSHLYLFKDFPNIMVEAEGDISKCTSSCNLANNITDAIGYQLSFVYWMFAFGLYFIIALLEERA